MDLEKEVESMRRYYSTGITKGASWRRTQLHGLLKFLQEEEAAICDALKQDLGKSYAEAFRDELGTTSKSIRYALQNLTNWMSSKEAKLPLVAILSSAKLVPEPLGLILIFASWNFPVGISLEPLVGAIVAGNTVVLKPSELSPCCSSLLAKSVPAYVDTQAIKVIEGGPEVGERLLQQKWDKIFFTGAHFSLGSHRVARIVMAAAAKYLTPIALELGGKCPAVIDSLPRTWEKQVAVKRVIGAKYGSCAGQACIAIDYALVEKSLAHPMIELMKESIETMFGADPKETKSVGRIVNKSHFMRLKTMLTDPEVQNCIVHGGSMDERNLFIEPTILLDPPLHTDIMSEEIFGPVLPIISLAKIEDSIPFINSRPEPLAIYVFTKDKALQRRIASETKSGSVVFNDALVQYAADTVPFGGIGACGIGQYHGKFSFDMFSHYKGIVKRSFLEYYWFSYPPWNASKLELFRRLYAYDYLGALLVILGLKRPRTVTLG